MRLTQYLMWNLLFTATSFALGASVYYLTDDTRYIFLQLITSLVFCFISAFIYLALKFNLGMNQDTKAIMLSMMQSLGKMIVALAILIPFYQMYCPVQNFYLLNFILTYLMFMVLDTIILSKE